MATKAPTFPPSQLEKTACACSSLQIPFPTVREAEIAYDVLRIDAEPARSACRKQIQLTDRQLSV